MHAVPRHQQLAERRERRERREGLDEVPWQLEAREVRHQLQVFERADAVLAARSVDAQLAELLGSANPRCVAPQHLRRHVQDAPTRGVVVITELLHDPDAARPRNARVASAGRHRSG